jgi:diguanylate cyclase (GGDEF)-like protein
LGNAGFCTVAARENRTIIIRDLESDLNWGTFREHALACGLRACWTTPLQSSAHKVLGTLVLYHREPFEPMVEEQELVNDYARILGIAIERHQSEERIQQLAFYDPMTQLPNRQLLMDRLGQRLSASARSPQNAAILFIDLDNFKMLNDTHGHDIGDLLLVEVAHRISAAVRESDTVSRLGGDEFVVIIDELDENAEQAAAQVRIVCEKLIALFSQSFLLNGYVHHATPSIGIALFNGSTQTSVDELLRRADLAMYRAKDSGRNCYRFFDQKMQTLVSERVQLEEDLRAAIAEQQFELYYQPQVDRQRGIIGAEALLRWRHPRHGLVLPVQFITQAEESGLILPIGYWVIKAACEQLARWADDPVTESLVLSINVSARQCLQPDFVDGIISLLEQTGANPQRLMLELTESVLVDNVDEIITRMNLLKASGLGFSLDDFGTGYSSLSYLKRMPFDQVKIDRSFVRDVMLDQNDAGIVRTIISLGLILNLQVVAEGVESEEQLDFLLTENCHLFQGYLFGKPLPIDKFETALREETFRSL